jgi:hypothetical protein
MKKAKAVSFNVHVMQTQILHFIVTSWLFETCAARARKKESTIYTKAIFFYSSSAFSALFRDFSLQQATIKHKDHCKWFCSPTIQTCSDQAQLQYISNSRVKVIVAKTLAPSSAIPQGKPHVSQHGTNISLRDDPHEAALELSHTACVNRTHKLITLDNSILKKWL